MCNRYRTTTCGREHWRRSKASTTNNGQWPLLFPFIREINRSLYGDLVVRLRHSLTLKRYCATILETNRQITETFTALSRVCQWRIKHQITKLFYILRLFTSKSGFFFHNHVKYFLHFWLDTRCMYLSRCGSTIAYGSIRRKYFLNKKILILQTWNWYAVCEFITLIIIRIV